MHIIMLLFPVTMLCMLFTVGSAAALMYCSSGTLGTVPKGLLRALLLPFVRYDVFWLAKGAAVEARAPSRCVDVAPASR